MADRYGGVDDDKNFEDRTAHVSHGDDPNDRSLAYPLVRNMSAEDRLHAENVMKRKIDWRLMPTLVIIYIMNYLDRNAIAAARIAGLEKELGLSVTEYNTALSILFVGYILMQVPSNMFLDKIGKPSLYLPTCMIVWGVISAATGATQSYAGLVVCRFFLGFIEAAYFPGCLFFLSSWYTRKELAFRTAILYSGSLISGAFGGLIAAGITGGLDGAHGLLAWRWLFIIEGVVTVFLAFIAFFVLPDFPKTTKWLSEEERQLACWRLERDIGEEDWSGSQAQKLTHGLKLAFTDVKTYVLGLLVFACVADGTVTNLFPTVVATLGYNRIHSLLLTAPPYALAVIVVFANAMHADKTGERYLHITIPLWISLAANILAAATTKTAPRYVAMMLMPASVYSGYVVALSWISSTLPRPAAKRAAALAAINAVSNSCSIYSSYLYTKKASPRYVGAFIHNGVMALVAIAAATVLRMMLRRLNKMLDEGQHVGGTGRVANTTVDVKKNEERGLPGVAAERGFRFLL